MERKTLLAVPAVIIGGFLGYLLYRKALTRTLYITAGEGGTTDPPPGTYMKIIGTQVTIKAVPEEGYTYGTWTVDGTDYGHVPEITITMDTDHIVVCTFWKGGQPPPTYPVALQSLGPIQVKSNIAAWTTGTPYIDQCIHVAHADENWQPNRLVHIPIKFKAIDAEGRGVPDIDVALWTEEMPDLSKYKGIMLLDDELHTIKNPLIHKTDSEGIVSANVSYLYGLNDKFGTICEDAGVGYQWGCGVLPCTVWTRALDGVCLTPLCGICWVTGDCETGKAGCEKMAPFQFNRISAQIVGTVISAVEYAYCGFHVKWM